MGVALAAPAAGGCLRRFLLALVDPDLSIRQLAEYLLGDALTTKSPLLAYNHYVEAIFMLNDCRLHASYDASGASVGATEKERTLFALVGDTPHVRAQRQVRCIGAHAPPVRWASR
jgi:condensin-2 complex subunit D3